MAVMVKPRPIAPQEVESIVNAACMEAYHANTARKYLTTIPKPKEKRGENNTFLNSPAP